MRRRIKYIRYVPLILVVLGAIAALIINYYIEKDNKVLFSAVKSLLNENEDGSFSIASIIENKDDFPVEVSGCYFENPGCDKTACDDIKILEPGERINIVIKCDGGVNRDEVGGFTIQSRRVGESERRTTTSGSSLFPGFNPGFLIPGGELNRGSGGGGGSGGGSGSGTPTQNPGNPGGGPGRIVTGDLPAPGWDSISEDNRQNDFYILDTTPTIYFFTAGNLCRWSVNDVSYSDMPSGNSCLVNSGAGLCNLPLQTQGPHSYSVACSLETTQNGVQVIRQNIASNNLDISGTIDSIAPVINTFSPLPGSTFPVSVTGVVIHATTNEITDCKAGVLAEPIEPVYGSSGMNIDCGLNSQSHSCTIPLSNVYNYVSLGCVDRALNIVYLRFIYLRFGDRFIPGIAVTIGTIGTFSSELIPITPPGGQEDSGEVSSGSGGGGGGGGGSSPQQPDSTPEGSPDGNPDGGGGDGDVVPGVGAVIREFDSEHTLFEGIFNWFKGLFK